MLTVSHTSLRSLEYYRVFFLLFNLKLSNLETKIEVISILSKSKNQQLRELQITESRICHIITK